MKEIRYLQNTCEDSTNYPLEFKEKAPPPYKISFGDNLYVHISSPDQDLSSFFNSGIYGSGSAYYNDAALYLNSYTVDDNGKIKLPLIGEFQAYNKTLNEISREINDAVLEYLTEVTITVKLANFHISIIGEVKNPGKYKIYQDNINIFEALAYAGDLNDFANRKQIKLIRTTANSKTIHLIDLTKDQIINSEFLYLMPNDIIYVEPLKGKQFSFEAFPYALVFSTITTGLLILNYFK